MPQGAELQQFYISGDLGQDNADSPLFRKRVEFLERFVKFIETYDKLPTENDIGIDPF